MKETVKGFRDIEAGKRTAIRKIIENYEKSRRYYTRQFWTLVSFILWYKMNFEFEKPEFQLDKYV